MSISAPKKNTPYQNLSLDDMEGEQWDDIPGLEGYYRIPKLGEEPGEFILKVCSNGQARKMKEKILKPEVAIQDNLSVNDKVYFLRSCLS